MTKLSEFQANTAKFLNYAMLAHVPVFLLLGLLIEAQAIWVTTFVLAVIVSAPILVHRAVGDGETHRFITAAGMVLIPAFLVFIFRGHPWQIDAHMYFFAAIAALSGLCDSRSIIVATVVTALHHLLLNFTIPAWVFPEGADFWRVVFHAVIVVLEAAILYWGAGKLSETLLQTEEASVEANKMAAAAQEMAEVAKTEAETAAKSREEAEEAMARMQEAAAERDRAAALVEESSQERDVREKLATEFESSLQVSVSELREVCEGLGQEADALQAISADSTSAMQAATNATGNVSQNVSSVASSAEEMSASVAEIARQVSKSTEVVQQAREQAGMSEGRIKELAERADKINDVLSMIGEIAEQTNLLALNATIEAARAGDAGKGFAVVASEVKSLANQSASATEEISRLLAGIRQATNDAVEVNQNIVKVIGEIGENSNGIAAAVQEQSAATEEIARAAQTAATETVEASQAVHNLAAMSGKMEEISSMTANAVTALSEQTQTLTAKSDDFVARIRS